MIDNYDRNIEYLRVSITDRCNLRCVYCLPEGNQENYISKDGLSLDELYLLIKNFIELGVKKVRITGGEPLVRKGIIEFLRKVRKIDKLEELCLTTNGVLLNKYAQDLYDLGLDSLNVSLDSFDEDIFNGMSRSNKFNDIFEGIKKSIALGFEKIKLNTVLIKEFNLNEITNFLNFIEKYKIDVRFIELMPIGEGKKYSPIYNKDVYKELEKQTTLIPLKDSDYKGPAKYYKTPTSKGKIGFISPMSHEICGSCNRIRITSEGFLKLCLYSKNGVDLKEIIRDEEKKNHLKEIILDNIKRKPKEHEFGKNTESQDVRLMSQIGG